LRKKDWPREKGGQWAEKREGEGELRIWVFFFFFKIFSNLFKFLI
jgi:hypothetical protein